MIGSSLLLLPPPPPTLALRFLATCAVICCSLAAGIRMSHSAKSRFSVVALAPGKPTMVPFAWRGRKCVFVCVVMLWYVYVFVGMHVVCTCANTSQGLDTVCSLQQICTIALCVHVYLKTQPPMLTKLVTLAYNLVLFQSLHINALLVVHYAAVLLNHTHQLGPSPAQVATTVETNVSKALWMVWMEK